LVIQLLQAQTLRLAMIGQGLEAKAQAWEAALVDRVSAPRWAATYGALSALEQEWSGLDMDAGLAVSRAAGLIIEAAA
jgi:hypothetical protein